MVKTTYESLCELSETLRQLGRVIAKEMRLEQMVDWLARKLDRRHGR